MDRQKAKILFDLLRSSSSEKVVKGLREIKKRLLTNGENVGVFSNFGLAKQCLKLVQRPNEEILNGTLSLLSICCTDPSIRTEIHNNEGVLHLHNVLKGTKSEPLQLRVVRTIANQSQHKVSCDGFFKLGSIELIISLLQQCKEDETKCASIRALRLLGNNGEHCKKIIIERGIFHVCNSSQGSSNNILMQEVFKALAHFSRFSHPICLKQIMEGTEDMSDILRLFENGDAALQELILRTILNIVRACTELKKQALFQLTSKLMDALAMARAPTIIVGELLNRKVPEMSEDKLIIALCDFCEGFGPSSKFNYPPLFVGRTWSQVLDCGGIHLFVSLLSKQHTNETVRSSVLRALTGVEYVFSFRDRILKHLLAAEIMPKLAEQFDLAMEEYRKVRRESQEGLCIHTLPIVPPPLASGSTAAGPSKDGSDKVCDDEKPVTISESEGEPKKKMEGNELLKEEELMEMSLIVDQSPSDKTPSSNQKSSVVYGSEGGSIHAAVHGLKGKGGVISAEVGGHYGKPTSPGICIVNPLSPSSVSCSPRSNQSSTGESGPNSPTWSPAQLGSPESPIFSPPLSSFVGGSGLCAWESPPSSRQPSPSSSPCYLPPWHSPPRPTSPIRPPSDWEYEEDEMEEADESGRFSPVIPKAKDSEETEEDTDDIDEGDTTNAEEANTEDEATSADDEDGARKGAAGRGGERVKEEGAIESDMKTMLVISPTSQKRSRDTSSPNCNNAEVVDPLEKKMKTGGIGVDVCLSLADLDTKDDYNQAAASAQEEPVAMLSDIDSPSKEKEESVTSQQKEGSSSSGEVKPELCKTPFIKMNQIKFRVRKKPRRQLSMDPEENASQNNMNQSLKVQERRTSSVCSESVYSELTADEFKWLQLLELLVRVIGQIAYIKEVIKSVCREFVPRIMAYLSTAQVIHKSATQMLKTIAKNSLSIPLLLDSLFIPYVAVELGEAGDPENPSGCSQCHILLDGSVGFLNEMVNFFNHIHLFGRCEVSNRLNPSQDHSKREGCVMALPHVTKCPRLLYDFMVSYPAMDLLMEVLHSDRNPNEASYMYATAAISRLAVTLQLDKQLQPVKCPVCSERRTHSPEEIAQHLRMQQEQSRVQGEAASEVFATPSDYEKSRQCKFALDKVRDVTFKLEGGETLSANREFLSEKNDVLKGMLMGSFAEGSSACVDLPETNKTALEMLIHYLYGCQCDFMENANFRSYLELVFLSQMYMVEKLTAFAVLKMISAIGEGSDIVMLYESGLGRIDEKIVLQAICTTLVRPMKTWKRARWFKELFQSKHSADIDHNIRVVLHHPLDINRLVCNCNQSLSLYAANETVYSNLR